MTENDKEINVGDVPSDEAVAIKSTKIITMEDVGKDPEVDVVIGMNVQMIRLALRMSQKDLAKAYECGQSFISYVEAGIHLNEVTLTKIAAGLGVSVPKILNYHLELQGSLRSENKD